MSSTTSTTVFVSGATGFIAQHVVKQLLEKGYSVVGSVRSAAKGESLKKLTKSDKFSYEVVPELSDEGAFDQALKNHPEVTVFLHTASPFTFNVTDIEKELLQPAIQGTKNVLTAISKYGPQIKRVVVTSSIAAMFSWAEGYNKQRVHTEEDWNPITYQESLQNPFNGYVGSKKFAELSAWEFVKENKPNFKISFIHPVYVFGPQAYEIKDKSQLNVSAEVINAVTKLGPNDQVPEVAGLFIDVRDVARAHIFGFESDEAINKRLLLSEGSFSSERIAQLIRKNFPKSNVPEGDLSKEPEQFKKHLFNVDNTQTRNLLAFKFIGLEQSIVDTVKQIYDS
ncbi:uncharacterized protein J8A68_005546 [[Candida] subhashii]|uniref:NAD-dependent epimerase/dehydratase domain-containing protein n=1 Tax=[Candida] subhashii TaxID=561895 RepID=A0A8J5UJ65_9ASCO|nr:uncharacterized protein J8A68_005546 [[Candida] subhashii]KAG7660871.1 hypothetical protein J8A68_005546 [[Candida] subhashii]